MIRCCNCKEVENDKNGDRGKYCYCRICHSIICFSGASHYQKLVLGQIELILHKRIHGRARKGSAFLWIQYDIKSRLSSI